MDIVTVVNRTSKRILGTWDGKPNILEPHAKGAFPVIVAEAIKRQNVLMGSEDPYTGEMQYLVGIEEYGDDLSPIEQSRSITRMNRAPFEANEKVIKPMGGTFSVKDRNETTSLPLDSNFVDAKV